MDKDLWKEAIREDADEKNMESCNRCQGRVHTKKREGIPIVERRERRSERDCKRAVEKRIHLAIKVTTNSASIFCVKERWKETNGVEL